MKKCRLPWVYTKQNKKIEKKKKIKSQKHQKFWSLKKKVYLCQKKKINSYTLVSILYDSRKEGYQFFNVSRNP